MLTDDQIADDLRHAFRAATDGLGYHGRVPTPRRGVARAVLVPTLATAAAAAAVAVPAVGFHDAPGTSTQSGRVRSPTAPTSASDGPSTSSATSSPSSLASGTLRSTLGSLSVGAKLASFGIAIDGAEAVGNEVTAVGGVEVPAGATPLDLPGVQDAYAGTDAVTGDAAVFLKVPADGGGTRVFELTSPTLTADQLGQLLRPENATPVPEVSR